jgi:hypothetical protein
VKADRSDVNKASNLQADLNPFEPPSANDQNPRPRQLFWRPATWPVALAWLLSSICIQGVLITFAYLLGLDAYHVSYAIAYCTGIEILPYRWWIIICLATLAPPLIATFVAIFVSRSPRVVLWILIFHALPVALLLAARWAC